MDSEEFLADQNARLRQAGNDLAIAAMRVVKDYDGTHRLAQAVADWMETIATEGRRENGERT